jgi:uncharacterized protein YecE (DUF72 family)
LQQSLETLDLMGEKLGALLFQFGYFNRTVFRSGGDFLVRLDPFLKKLPKRYKFAVEIRNKNWFSKPLFDLLRAHKVACALIDQAWMPRVSGYLRSLIPSPPISLTSGSCGIGRESRNKRKSGTR